MPTRIQVSIAALALTLGVTTADAQRVDAPVHDLAHESVGPERRDDLAARAAAWSRDGAWLVAPTARPSGGGSRVVALIEVMQGGAVELAARGVAPDGRRGPWLPLAETHAGAVSRVAVVDLGQRWAGADLRVSARDDARIGELGWELVAPTYPDAGRAARAAALEAPELLRALDPVFGTIGVVSREAWGARPTQCTSPEDDWTRMAIHHTAGPQSEGGSVAEVLRALQAYEQDGGTFCDLPYQFMVGHDGTMYEGRPLNLLSAATGGNNPGNLAICFVGCYHPTSECPPPPGNQVTEAMMTSARLLVQTAARAHDIGTTDDDIRGHRGYGNPTACPGDLVFERLDELRADLTWFAAAETARSFGPDGELAVTAGAATEVWVELENLGGLPWEPGVTFLAPTPRDEGSPLHDDSWPSPTRAATIEQPVAPGEVGRFTFAVSAAAAGTIEQSFGLTHDGTTWFADAPWGGGPGDDAVVLRVTSAPGGSDDGPDGDDDDPQTDEAIETDEDRGGCRADGGGRGPFAVAVAGLAAALRRRRRDRRPTGT